VFFNLRIRQRPMIGTARQKAKIQLPHRYIISVNALTNCANFHEFLQTRKCPEPCISWNIRQVRLESLIGFGVIGNDEKFLYGVTYRDLALPATALGGEIEVDGIDWFNRMAHDGFFFYRLICFNWL